MARGSDQNDRTPSLEKNNGEMMAQVDQAKEMTLCKLIEVILFDEKTGNLAKDPARANQT